MEIQLDFPVFRSFILFFLKLFLPAVAFSASGMEFYSAVKKLNGKNF